MLDCQVFCFNNLQMPPFFFAATLPQRLAMIRHIHLHYLEREPHCPDKTADLTSEHVRACLSCNFCQWLDNIKKSLTGIRSILLTIDFCIDLTSHHSPMAKVQAHLSMQTPWVVRLISLDHSMKAGLMLEMKLRFSNQTMSSTEETFVWQRKSRSKLQFFESQLKEKLKKTRGPRDAIVDIPEQ